MHCYAVDLAAEGREAWGKLTSRTYDCILLDLKMPGMSGSELFHLIEASDQQVAKKVIFITGDAINSDTRDLLEMAPNPTVLKPFNLDDIHRKVLQVVQSS